MPIRGDRWRFAGEFKRAGFRGGINWYRNLDRNWQLTPFLDGARLRQPASRRSSRARVTGFQQERPNETNELRVEFAKGI